MPTTLSGCFIGVILSPRARHDAGGMPLPTARLGVALHETEDVAVRIADQRDRHDARNLGNRHHDCGAEALRPIQIDLQVIHLGVERHTARAFARPDGAIDAQARLRIYQAVIEGILPLDLPAEEVGIELLQLHSSLGRDDLPVDDRVGHALLPFSSWSRPAFHTYRLSARLATLHRMEPAIARLPTEHRERVRVLPSWRIFPAAGATARKGARVWGRKRLCRKRG